MSAARKLKFRVKRSLSRVQEDQTHELWVGIIAQLFVVTLFDFAEEKKMQHLQNKLEIFRQILTLWIKFLWKHFDTPYFGIVSVHNSRNFLTRLHLEKIFHFSKFLTRRKVVTRARSITRLLKLVDDTSSLVVLHPKRHIGCKQNQA